MRRRAVDYDPATVLRLARHDVENMIGIIARRKDEDKPASFGHTNWCLTLDRMAPEVYSELRREFSAILRFSPFISADFLINYLAFGPVRRQISKDTEAALPIVLEHVLFPVLPNELLDIANRVRTDNSKLPESIVRRRIRDELDKARVRLGPISMAGLEDVDRALASKAN
jgi:hypothetical protein